MAMSTTERVRKHRQGAEGQRFELRAHPDDVQKIRAFAAQLALERAEQRVGAASCRKGAESR